MTLFYGTWKIMDHMRVPCMTYFASMTREDDLNELKGVELLGRWSDLGTASGSCIFRANNYMDAASWLYNWVPMATCQVKPICDDNTARKIILNARLQVRCYIHWLNCNATSERFNIYVEPCAVFCLNNESIWRQDLSL